MSDVWTPRMTVSAVIERAGKFLFVEELDECGRASFNQPAGHLENNEGLLEAVEREVREETGYSFRAQSFSGLYRWLAPRSGLTFMRLNFIGVVSSEVVCDQLDKDIIAVHWLTRDEVAQENLRSPLVLTCVDDYLQRPHYPLSAIIDQR